MTVDVLRQVGEDRLSAEAVAEVLDDGRLRRVVVGEHLLPLRVVDLAVAALGVLQLELLEVGRHVRLLDGDLELLGGGVELGLLHELRDEALPGAACASAEPGFGQAFLAALYCTQTCVISEVSLLRGTVSPPIDGDALGRHGVLVLAAVGRSRTSVGAGAPAARADQKRDGAEGETGERHAETDGQMHGTAL